ncbi:DUF2441 domain-containing protein [Bradyrhizobium diazoefficiens]|uniref:DUF2441 domain-containing protein n=1 Tax=Bradyrhizobium diazoefficiens TaxID=1355477 RepID=UPI00190C597A|nr:DUF2441 domain-containing protein [Bradyrhizobium diazoefficiens]QQO31164.1 DUF2441 domain-containing protein [Bradyrhizobium diazoefficiens]
MPYFACSLLLEAGSVVRPGNWGRIVRLIGNRHTEWPRETILEEVRAKEFPALPSRFDCAFVIDAEEEARFYFSKFAPLAVLYEVALIGPAAKSHEADWKGTGPYDDTKEWARRYWRGDVMPHPETHMRLREGRVPADGVAR